MTLPSDAWLYERGKQAHIGNGPVASIGQDAPLELVIALVCETARMVGGMVPVARD